MLGIGIFGKPPGHILRYYLCYTMDKDLVDY